MKVRTFRKIAEDIATGMGLTANDIRWEFFTQGHQGSFKTTRYALFDDTDLCSEYLTKPVRAKLSAKGIVVCYGGIFCSNVEGDLTEFEYDEMYKNIQFINLSSPSQQQEKVPAPLNVFSEDKKKIYFVENSQGISFVWDNNKMCCKYIDGVLHPAWSMNSWGVFMCWAKEKGLLPKIRVTRIVPFGSYLPDVLSQAKTLASTSKKEKEMKILITTLLEEIKNQNNVEEKESNREPQS